MQASKNNDVDVSVTPHTVGESVKAGHVFSGLVAEVKATRTRTSGERGEK